jgi:hypothetical protein
MASYHEPAFSDDMLTSAVAETEREILRDAMGEGDLADGIDNSLVDDMSQMHGWDDEPLSDAEQIQTTAHGHEQEGFDRPLGLAEERGELRESEMLRAQLAERDQQIQELLDQTGPVREARERMQQQRREALLDAVVDPARADQVLAHMENQQGQIHSNNMSRVNAALEAAHAKYGSDFETTYQAIRAMDARNPLTNQIVRSIFDFPDPGEALMHLHGNPLLETLSSGSPPPPFMPGSRSASRARSQSERVEFGGVFDDAHSSVTSEREGDIFRAATR